MAEILEALPPADAIAALERRGRRLDPTFAWQDVFQDDHATMFTVAKSAGFDILGDVHGAFEAALKTGGTERDFNRRLVPVLQGKGWWGKEIVRDPATGEDVVAQLGSLRRLRTIFQVNMRVSYAAGHWANFERNKAARPFLRYVCILDEATRPEHRLRHNLCLPVDHPYWDVWAPPCGWNCRCTLQSLSQRDVDRMRGQLHFEPPPDLQRDWLNKRTGEVSRVPQGIDPGWAYNPGKAGFRAGLAGSDRLIAAPPRLAATAVADPDWIARPLTAEFGAWFDEAAAGGRVERSLVTIGAMHEDVLAALKTRAIEPATGAITIDQRAVRHILRDAKASTGRAVPVETLRRLPDLLAAPIAVLRDINDDALIYVFDAADPGRAGKIVVRMNFAAKARDAGGKPQPIRTNAIRTIELVGEVDLRNLGQYEILTGSV